MCAQTWDVHLDASGQFPARIGASEQKGCHVVTFEAEVQMEGAAAQSEAAASTVIAPSTKNGWRVERASASTQRAKAPRTLAQSSLWCVAGASGTTFAVAARIRHLVAIARTFRRAAELPIRIADFPTFQIDDHCLPTPMPSNAIKH